MKMLTKHFDISMVGQALLTSRTIKSPIREHHNSAHCLAVAALVRMDSAIRSAVPMGISPTTVTIISP
ncbi:hypothetical protein QF019_001060 [Pseudomonas frederiksbergensis]